MYHAGYEGSEHCRKTRVVYFFCTVATTFSAGITKEIILLINEQEICKNRSQTDALYFKWKNIKENVNIFRKIAVISPFL